MGGNALKNCETRRVNKEEYAALCKKVVDTVQRHKEHLREQRNYVLSIGFRIKIIESYRNKETFGDLDAVFFTDMTMPEVAEFCKTNWQSKEVVINGNCVSAECDGFQVDLICYPTGRWEGIFATHYFAWNDLGNLMGRVAHKMGLKLGHDGLYYCLRDGTHFLDEILVTNNFTTAIEFLGFSSVRYSKGFDSLEDIFEFVAANPYFNPDIYLLDQVNAVARIRDKKRKTYMAFLDWCEEYKAKNPDKKYYEFPKHKTVWIPTVIEHFPDFKSKLYQAHQENAMREYMKSKFNGNLVSELTGLEDRELGEFMAYIYSNVGGKGSESAKAWILNTTPEHKADIIKQLHYTFSTYHKKRV